MAEPTSREPLELLLDFVRADKGHDPHAFRFEPQDYLILKEKGGVSRASFSWGPETMKDLESLQGEESAPQAESRLGDELRSLLSGAEAQIEAALAQRRRIRLTIRSAAAELYALPWELLRLSGQGLPLWAYPGVTIRYTWPGTHTTAPSPDPRPEGGRILFAWSEAGGVMPKAEHLEALENAAKAGHLSFDPAQDVLPEVSLKKLGDKLEQASADGKPYAILHLLCHGEPLGGEPRTFGLSWNGSSPLVERDIVSANRLRDRLYRHASTLRLVVLCVCQSGDMGEPGSHLGSVAHELHRVGFEAVVASRFLLSVPGSITLARTFYSRMLEGLESLEEAFLDSRSALSDAGLPTLDHVAIQLYGRPEDGWDTRPVVIRPYQGLRAFQPEHARFFFGRSVEREALLERVLDAEAGKRPRFQVLAAASGTGKSSLVLAGVVPELVQRGWRWRVFRPAELAQEASPLDAALEEGAKGLQPSSPLLLVVDQFEEIFTRTSSPAERDAIVRKLWALTQRPGVVVLCTLRVDFLGRCGEVTVEEGGQRLDQVVYGEAHRMFLPTMNEARMAEVITGPALLAGLEFQGGLVEALLRDVAGEPGALPLLEYTLDRLWEQRRGRLLTHEAYKAVGGVEGALAGTADRLMADFSSREKEQARRLFVAMVGTREEGALDTRRRVWIDDERPSVPEAQEIFDRVVEALVASRLVVKGLDTASKKGAWLEVAHEALIRKWLVLREWVVQDLKLLEHRRELEVLAEGWERSTSDADGGASYLLTGQRLRRATDLRQRVILGSRVLRFVEASEQFARHRAAPLDDLEEQGWGVIAPEGERGDRLLERIRDLMAYRERLQHRPVRVYRVPPELDAAGAIRWRQSVYLDPAVSPRERPVYLLILGDLHEVSLDLQQELSGELMVGRLAFRRDEDYEAYAAKVLRWEQSLPASTAARLLLVVARDDSTVTELSYSEFVKPCQEQVSKEIDDRTFPKVHLSVVAEPDLNEELLAWASQPGPGMVVSLSHGMSPPGKGWASQEEQYENQGSLMSQTADAQLQAFTAADVEGRVFLPGGMWLMLASYSAGTRGRDRYGPIIEDDPRARRAVVHHEGMPFVTALPQALLSNPEGPLAVIGWVDVGWANVFIGWDGERKLSRFLDLLRIVCKGNRIGTAMARFFRDIPALMSQALTLFEMEQEARSRQKSGPIDEALSSRRMHAQLERHSLRDIILLGDPAARLSLSSQALPPGPDAR
jgi:hypothetical protein